MSPDTWGDSTSSGRGLRRVRRARRCRRCRLHWMNRRLDIAFVSDVACPWCAIGLASLDQALARVGTEVEATVRVEPFELNPDMGPEGAELVKYIARKYG